MIRKNYEYTVTTIATAIRFTWVFNHAKGSILISVLILASQNATQAWMSVLIPDFPMEAAGKMIQGSYFVVAVALVLVTKGRLGYAADPVERN